MDYEQFKERIEEDLHQALADHGIDVNLSQHHVEKPTRIYVKNFMDMESIRFAYLIGTAVLEKNELLNGQAVGQFVSITDTFYIFDIEFYQKLFADNGFMDSLKYFQDTEVDKNAEESFNSLNRESRRSDNVKKQKEELVDNAKNENEKNIEVLKKLVNMLSSVIPYPQILCIANYAVVLNEKYLRDDIKTAAFKYGGKITVVGYITNKISGQANTPISAFANVNQSMNALVNIFFENADETYVVHPIAVYYDN